MNGMEDLYYKCHRYSIVSLEISRSFLDLLFLNYINDRNDLNVNRTWSQWSKILPWFSILPELRMRKWRKPFTQGVAWLCMFHRAWWSRCQQSTHSESVRWIHGLNTQAPWCLSLWVAAVVCQSNDNSLLQHIEYTYMSFIFFFINIHIYTYIIYILQILIVYWYILYMCLFSPVQQRSQGNRQLLCESLVESMIAWLD